MGATVPKNLGHLFSKKPILHLSRHPFLRVPTLTVKLMNLFSVKTYLILALLIACTSNSLEAKTYLTPIQAEKVCFPAADKFEWKTHRYTRDEIQKIYDASGLKVIDPGLWYCTAYKDNKVVGVIAFDRCIGKHLFIDFVIAITPEGRVKQVEILNYRESWGYEVRREGWRNQFVGKDTAAKLDHNNGISNISGATLSCRGVTRGVKRICHTWGIVMRPALVAAGRLPKQ